jgi:uncharacterized protein
MSATATGIGFAQTCTPQDAQVRGYIAASGYRVPQKEQNVSRGMGPGDTTRPPTDPLTLARPGAHAAAVSAGPAPPAAQGEIDAIDATEGRPPSGPLAPVAPPERVAALDVLRGLALFGVLASNVYALFSTHWIRPDFAMNGSPLDAVAAYFVELVIAGKAMGLLTFLFGLGFASQLLRADARGEDARPLFVRRLAALFLFGACHVTFLWWGDVTWTYALSGFALLAFRRRAPRTLLLWAFGLILIPRLLVAIPEIQKAVYGALPHPADPRAFRAEVNAAIHGADHITLSWVHVRHAFYFVTMIAAWYFPWLVGRFLLGYYAGQRRLFDGDGAAHLPLFRRLVPWGLAIGAADATVRLLLQSSLMAGRELLLPTRLGVILLIELSTLGLVAAYASIAVLLLQRPAWRRVLLVVAPVGRMPLTTYLSQSVAATFVFYGWGLDRAGRTAAAGCLAISVVIFALQIAVAHLWLRRFCYGPAEWLWRTLAYGRRPPMRA